MPFYSTFLEKPQWTKAKKKLNETKERGKTYCLGKVNKFEAQKLACFTTVIKIMLPQIPQNSNILKNLRRKLAMFE